MIAQVLLSIRLIQSLLDHFLAEIRTNVFTRHWWVKA